MDTEDDRPPRNKDPGVLTGLLVGGLVGALAAAALLAIGNSSSGSDLSELRLIQQLGRADATLTGWDLLVLPVLFLIVLGAHEVGHLIGGMSQGMRFLVLIVGPFGWHASVAGPRFEWNTNLALMGGIAATLPTEVGASLRRQMLVLVAGGPLASLLLTVLAVALASLSDPRFTAYGIFIAATSFGIFLVTLIPVRTGGFMSDGMQIIDLLRGGSAVIERSAIMHIFAQSLDGVRPRDWDPSSIDELKRIGADDPLRSTGAALYLLYRAMDSRDTTDIERYGREIEEGLASYPTGFKQSLHVELAICGWLKGDADAVRRHLGESRGGVVEKSRRLLAQAALARLESRSEDCERHRRLAIKALAKASDAGQGKLTEDQLAML